MIHMYTFTNLQKYIALIYNTASSQMSSHSNLREFFISKAVIRF